jgi:Putative beta-barrel porin-2, OmpL-like. bbp2
MFGLRKLRFADIGTGLSMIISTAGLLAASALHAADPACSQPASPAVCNDQIFMDAAQRLKNLNPCVCADGCTTTNSTTNSTSAACVPAAPACGDGGSSAASDAPWGLTDIFDDGCGNNHFKDNGWKLGGNLAQSYAANANGRGNGYNGPVTWTDQANQYQLNQAWFYAEKATDTSKKDWDWGARADLLYGTNARLTTESGLETRRIDSNGGTYGLALPQFYAEVAYKKLKIKAGHFISPIGYFTVDTTQNFFNTIPYTYQWGEPFTHTGIMATYQFTDNFVASSGVTRGWDNFGNANPNLGYLGTWAYTLPDKSNIAQVIVWSHEPNAVNAFTERYYQSLVYTKPIDDNWTYVGQSDFGTQVAATTTGQRANWYGVNQYIYRKFSDKWTWGFNFEWWRDEEGYRVAGFLPGNAPSGITGNMAGVPGGANGLAGGYNGNFFQTTMGPRWYPTGKPNLFLRPNLRYDWYSGGSAIPGNQPFGNGDKSSQALFVTDLCWLF